VAAAAVDEADVDELAGFLSVPDEPVAALGETGVGDVPTVTGGAVLVGVLAVPGGAAVVVGDEVVVVVLEAIVTTKNPPTFCPVTWSGEESPT